MTAINSIKKSLNQAAIKTKAAGEKFAHDHQEEINTVTTKIVETKIKVEESDAGKKSRQNVPRLRNESRGKRVRKEGQVRRRQVRFRAQRGNRKHEIQIGKGSEGGKRKVRTGDESR